MRISRYAGQNKDTSAVEPDRGDVSNAPSATNNTVGVAGTSNGSGAQASKGVNTEVQTKGTGQGRSAPDLTKEAPSGKSSTKKGERVRRQRLVSYLVKIHKIQMGREKVPEREQQYQNSAGL